jgi:hypothetical protein
MLTVIDESDRGVLTIRIGETTIDIASGDLTTQQPYRFGLVDVVNDTVDTAVHAAIKALRSVTTEAVCFTRRISRRLPGAGSSAATELAKAARYKTSKPNNYVVNTTVSARRRVNVRNHQS